MRLWQMKTLPIEGWGVRFAYSRGSTGSIIMRGQIIGISGVDAIIAVEIRRAWIRFSGTSAHAVHQRHHVIAVDHAIMVEIVAIMVVYLSKCGHVRAVDDAVEIEVGPWGIRWPAQSDVIE